nr:MAG TPA: hypothetical protein [Caudoviricetes sp.]
MKIFASLTSHNVRQKIICFLGGRRGGGVEPTFVRFIRTYLFVCLLHTSSCIPYITLHAMSICVSINTSTPLTTSNRKE